MFIRLWDKREQSRVRSSNSALIDEVFCEKFSFSLSVCLWIHISETKIGKCEKNHIAIAFFLESLHLFQTCWICQNDSQRLWQNLNVRSHDLSLTLLLAWLFPYKLLFPLNKLISVKSAQKQLHLILKSVTGELRKLLKHHDKPLN